MLPSPQSSLWSSEILRLLWEQMENLKQGRLNVSGRGSGWKAFKQTGTTLICGLCWDAPTSAEGGGPCHCEAPLNYNWKVMVVGEGL